MNLQQLVFFLYLIIPLSLFYSGCFFPSACYLIALGQTVVEGPLRDMKEIKDVESNTAAFKMSVRAKALEYEKEKQKNRTSVLNSGMRALPLTFVKELQYIEEMIFDSGRSQGLTKTELEMLLLRELGTSYNSQTLEYVLSIASQTNVSTYM